jgi:hypothetical protein
MVIVLAWYVVECEAENWFQSGAQVENVRSCAFRASYIFMAWCQFSTEKNLPLSFYAVHCDFSYS